MLDYSALQRQKAVTTESLIPKIKFEHDQNYTKFVQNNLTATHIA